MGHRILGCLITAVLAAVSAGAVSGCTVERHWGGSSAAGSNGKATIGLVTKTNTNPYFVELRNAASAAAQAGSSVSLTRPSLPAQTSRSASSRNSS